MRRSRETVVLLAQAIAEIAVGHYATALACVKQALEALEEWYADRQDIRAGD